MFYSAKYLMRLHPFVQHKLIAEMYENIINICSNWFNISNWFLFWGNVTQGLMGNVWDNFAQSYCFFKINSQYYRWVYLREINKFNLQNRINILSVGKLLVAPGVMLATRAFNSSISPWASSSSLRCRANLSWCLSKARSTFLACVAWLSRNRWNCDSKAFTWASKVVT